MNLKSLALTASITTLGIVSYGAIEPASAVIFYAPSGLTNPATTIDFSEIPLANDTAMSSQYFSQGVIFGNGLFYNTTVPSATLPNFSGAGIKNFSSTSTASSPVGILFNQAQNRAAFAFATDPGSNIKVTVDALINGALQDTLTVDFNTLDLGINTGFFNVLPTSGFNSIRISTSNNLPGATPRVYLDNLQFGTGAATAVPEPVSAIGTLIAGASAIGLKRRFTAKTGAGCKIKQQKIPQITNSQLPNMSTTET